LDLLQAQPLADWQTFSAKQNAITPQAVTAGSAKIQLSGTPATAALQPFSIDVNEANLSLNTIGGVLNPAKGGTGVSPIAADDGKYLTWNNVGGSYVFTTPSASVTANNGLTKTGSNIQLGGVLTQDTNITTGAGVFNLSFTEATNGSVLIGTQTPLSGTKLRVSNGDITIDPNRQLKINGSNSTAQLLYLGNNSGQFASFTKSSAFTSPGLTTMMSLIATNAIISGGTNLNDTVGLSKLLINSTGTLFKGASQTFTTIPDPTTTVDIDSGNTTSGLRLRNLTSSSSVTAGAGAIGVDTTGNVVRVSGSSNNLSVSTLSSSSPLTLSEDVVLIDSTSASVIATLPTASGNSGKHYRIKWISSANTATVLATNPDTIDGTTSYIFSLQNQTIEVISNGTNWYIF
jgi:hypothetical protein